MNWCGKILGEPANFDAYRWMLGTESQALEKPRPHGMLTGEVGD